MQIDPVALWQNYVDFPAGMRVDDDTEFLPLVTCPNPEHDTTKLHFQINTREPLVHCFARCGISGTYQHAISVIEGYYEKHNGSKPLAWRDAKRIILKEGKNSSKFYRTRKTREIPKPSSVKSPNLNYQSYLPPVAQEYLKARKISPESISKWEIGWDSISGRVVIPAKDENGRIRFLISRSVTSSNPKYLYSQGYPKNSLLFGTCYLDPEMIRSHGLVVVEGSIDAIRLHQHGLRNVVATLGTGISEAQRNIISRLRPRKVYLFFDKDLAGVRSIEIALKMLKKYPLYVVRYPRDKYDPAEMSREQVFRQMEKAVPAMKFKTSLSATRL